ncbi:hypothetical protein [Streptomyces sp. NPDC048196]|uniref:hypothetical protein n=1 Tax=Streptomyces sp. NPDC048196 TaxID=3154712 RepID=UPI0033D5452A
MRPERTGAAVRPRTPPRNQQPPGRPTLPAGQVSATSAPPALTTREEPHTLR